MADWDTGGEKEQNAQEIEAGKKAGGKMCAEPMLKQKHLHICSYQEIRFGNR